METTTLIVVDSENEEFHSNILCLIKQGSSSALSPNNTPVTKSRTEDKTTTHQSPQTTPMNKVTPTSPANFESSELECSLCFRIFCRPVSTPCGHTYCKSCLLAALKYSPLCPLCRSKLEPASKHKYAINIVISTLLEKHFKEEHEQREKEEQEDEEQEALANVDNSNIELEDYYTRWSNCLIPSVRETCCVLLSCT